VRFVWESFSFEGVIESMNVSYTLFSDDGFPIRAKLSIALKQYTTVAQQRGRAKKKSPDVEKTYVVQRGDTLSGIAERAYGDPAPWRQIARANGISDARELVPGRVLTIPRLEVTP
jgi:nucleoid-associated protein YgaU